MHLYEMCLSHAIYYQHVSTAVATIIKVTYKNIMSPNNLSKCLSVPVFVAKIAFFVESSWNVMAYGDAREGNVVYPALLPLLPLMHTPRLPAVDWTDASADLNGLVRFVERRNLVSARVP